MPNEVTVIQADRELKAWQEDCGLKNTPTHLTIEYRKAVSGQDADPPFMSVAYNWQDKPHRLVMELCNKIESDAAETQALADKLERAVATLDALVFDVRALIPHIINKSVRDKIHSITNTQALKGEG